MAGDHLVFVNAKTERKNLYQWIYNDANIDLSRIVWARDLGDARNAQLAAYYNGSREVWMVDPNVEPATIERMKYEAAGNPVNPAPTRWAEDVQRSP